MGECKEAYHEGVLGLTGASSTGVEESWLWKYK